MVDIIAVIILFIFGIWLGMQAYKIGQKHGIIIGRAQLAKEIMVQQEQQRIYEDFINSYKEEFEN